MPNTYIDEYETQYPIKDHDDYTLKVQRTMTPSHDFHIYTVNLDNQLHGLYRVYAHGSILKEYEYKNGKLHGRCMEWSPYTGYVRKVTNYKDGFMHGNYVEYITIEQLEDGEKVTYLVATTNCTYYNNVIQGPSYRYDIETGQIKTRYYIDGLLCVPSAQGGARLAFKNNSIKQSLMHK